MNVSDLDRHIICNLGKLFIGGGKDNYSSDAVYRAIIKYIKEDQNTNSPKLKFENASMIYTEIPSFAEFVKGKMKIEPS